jgi:hypothetical protein
MNIIFLVDYIYLDNIDNQTEQKNDDTCCKKYEENVFDNWR